MNHFIAIFACASLVLAGAALGHSPNSNSDCSIVNADESLIVAGIPLAVTLGESTIYVSAAVGIFTEANGYPGLQTHEHTCTVKDGQKPWPVVTVGPDSPLL